MQDSYKIDLEQLREYIEQLERLYTNFPEKLLIKHQEGNNKGLVNNAMNSICAVVTNMQMQLASLIFNTKMYMEKIENDVKENDIKSSSTLK